MSAHRLTGTSGRRNEDMTSFAGLPTMLFPKPLNEANRQGYGNESAHHQYYFHVFKGHSSSLGIRIGFPIPMMLVWESGIHAPEYQ